MSRDTRALLEDAVGSDVQFSVQGEVLQAHSQLGGPVVPFSFFWFKVPF